MYIVEHLHRGYPGPAKTLGGFATLDEARKAAHKLYDETVLVAGIDSIRICKDGREVERVEAGDL